MQCHNKANAVDKQSPHALFAAWKQCHNKANDVDKHCYGQTYNKKKGSYSIVWHRICTHS